MKTFQTILLFASLTMGGGIAHGTHVKMPPADKEAFTQQILAIPSPDTMEVKKCMVDLSLNILNDLHIQYDSGRKQVIINDRGLYLEYIRRIELSYIFCTSKPTK